MDKEKFFRVIAGVVAFVFFITSSAQAAPLASALRPASEFNTGRTSLADKLKTQAGPDNGGLFLENPSIELVPQAIPLAAKFAKRLLKYSRNKNAKEITKQIAEYIINEGDGNFIKALTGGKDLDKKSVDSVDKVAKEALKILAKMSHIGLFEEKIAEIILRNVNDSALAGNTLAKEWIKDYGTGMGLGMASFIATFRDEPVDLESLGVAPYFGIGIAVPVTRDLLLETVREVVKQELTRTYNIKQAEAEQLASGIVRSKADSTKAKSSSAGKNVYPLKIDISQTEDGMGEKAAQGVFEAFKRRLTYNQKHNNDYVVINFAAAPSQDAFLKRFVELFNKADEEYAQAHGVERYYTSRLRGVHMDEYEGLDAQHPASFKRYLLEHIAVPLRLVFSRNLKENQFFFLGDYNNEDYMEIINELGGIDITCCGIGENGHLAFNDPPADFTASGIIRVRLDKRCRIQQVRDYPRIYNPKGLPIFDDSGKVVNESNLNIVLKNVPEFARTMTITEMLRPSEVFVIVPRKAKAEAVKAMIRSGINTDIPATALKTHPNVHIYLDRDSASLLEPSDIDIATKPAIIGEGSGERFTDETTKSSSAGRANVTQADHSDKKLTGIERKRTGLSAGFFAWDRYSKGEQVIWELKVGEPLKNLNFAEGIEELTPTQAEIRLRQLTSRLRIAGALAEEGFKHLSGAELFSKAITLEKRAEQTNPLIVLKSLPQTPDAWAKYFESPDAYEYFKKAWSKQVIEWISNMLLPWAKKGLVSIGGERVKWARTETLQRVYQYKEAIFELTRDNSVIVGWNEAKPTELILKVLSPSKDFNIDKEGADLRAQRLFDATYKDILGMGLPYSAISVKSASAGYEYEEVAAGQIARFCERLMPDLEKSAREHIIVENMIISLDIPKLINDIKISTERHILRTLFIKSELKTFPLLKDMIDKYGSGQIVSIRTESDSPALELMNLIGKIADQQEVDEPLMAVIFFDCVKAKEFIDRLCILEELRQKQPHEIAVKVAAYPILDPIRSNYTRKLLSKFEEPKASDLKPSSAGITVEVNKVPAIFGYLDIEERDSIRSIISGLTGKDGLRSSDPWKNAWAVINLSFFDKEIIYRNRKDVMPTLTSKGGLLNRNSWKRLWSAIGLSLLDKKTKSEYKEDIISIFAGKDGIKSRDPWKRLWAAIGLFLFDKETRTEYREEIESILPGEVGLRSSSPWRRIRAAVSLSLLDKKTASRYKEDIISIFTGKNGLRSKDPWKKVWAAIGLLSIDKGKRILRVNINYTGLKRPHTILAKDANELAAKLQKEVFTGLGISCQALSDKRIELSTRYAYGKTVTEAINIYPEEKLEKILLKVLASKVFTASPEFSTAVKFPPDVKSYKDILQDLIDLEARRKDKLVNTLRIMKKPVSFNRISKSTNKDGYGDGLRLVHGLPQGARDNFNAVMEQNHGIGYWTAYLAGVRVRQTLERIANQLRAEQIKAEKSQARFKYSDAGFIVDARIHHREFLQLQFSEGVVKQLLALFKEISGAKRRSPSVFIEAMEKYNYPNIVSAIHINPDETMRNWRWEYLILVDDYGVDKIIYATVKPGKKPPYVINYHNIRITALDKFVKFVLPFIEELSKENPEAAECWNETLKRIGPQDTAGLAKSSSAGVSDVVEVGMANYAPPIPVITTPPAYAELIKMGLGDKLRILVGIFNKELKDVTALDDIKHWIPLKELKKDTIEQIYFIGYKIAMDSIPPSRVYGVRTKSGIELIVSPDSKIPQLAEVPEAIALCDAKAAIKAAAKSSSAGEPVDDSSKGITELIMLGNRPSISVKTTDEDYSQLIKMGLGDKLRRLVELLNGEEFRNVLEVDESQQRAAIDKTGLEIESINFLGFKLSLPVGSPSSRVYALRLKPDLDLVILPESHMPHLMDAPNALILCDAKIGIVAKAKSSSAGEVEIPVSGKANNIRCFSEQVLNERLSASPGLKRELQKVLELCERRLKPSKDELAVFLGPEKLDPSSLRVYAQVKRHPDDLPGKVTIAHTIRDKEGYLLFALFTEQEASAVGIPYSPQERKPDQARDGLIKERKMALIKTIDGKEVSPPRTVEFTVGDKILVISIEPSDYRNRMSEGSATLRDMQEVRSILASLGGRDIYSIRSELKTLGLLALNCDSLEYLGKYEDERVFVIESIYFDEMFFFSDKCVESLSNESTEMIRLSADGHMGVVRQIKPAKFSSAGQVEFIMNTVAERLAGFFFLPADRLNVEAIGELQAALEEQKSRLTGLGKLSCPAEDAVRAGLAITLGNYLQAIDEGERLALVNDGFNKILEKILPEKTDLKLHHYQPAETNVTGTIIINEDELQNEQKNEMVRLFSKISKYRAEAIERLGTNVVLKSEYNRDEDCTPHMVAISKNPIPAAKEARLLDITIEHTPDALLPVDKGLLFAKGLLLYLATDRAPEVEVKLSELYRLLRKGQGEPLQETGLLEKFIDERVFTLLLPKPERVDKEQYQKLLRLRLLTLIAA